MLEIHDYAADNALFQAIINRAASTDKDVLSASADIVEAVRTQGDAALFDAIARFDHATLTPDTLRVSAEEFEAAEAQVDNAFLAATTQAIENIRNFHSYQDRPGYIHDDGDGVLLSKRVLPIQRVGVYCPGGTAPLFSSILMNVIPAQIAGVPDIAVATPPRADGTINPHILMACAMLGVKQVYKMGGAHAIAALAYGTATVARVDKIVGPGNAYVAAAKRLVYGQVGLDAVAGPSEVVIIADRTANPEYVAADLLSQVEHGSGFEAGVVLTTDHKIAEAIREAVTTQLAALPRMETATTALTRYGGIFVVKSLEEAAEVANLIAPEHLEIQTGDPASVAENIVHAGAIFLGALSTEPIGDYFAGTNHVLPTGGAARFSSSLSVYDFLKDISIIRYSAERLASTGRHIIAMAEIEGLEAHANAVRLRVDDLALLPRHNDDA